MSDTSDRIKSIKDFESLVEYLRKDLGWPLDAEDIDDVAFEYDPEELGLDSSCAVAIRQIKQIRPLVAEQPWGVFYLETRVKKSSASPRKSEGLRACS